MLKRTGLSGENRLRRLKYNEMEWTNRMLANTTFTCIYIVIYYGKFCDHNEVIHKICKYLIGEQYPIRQDSQHAHVYLRAKNFFVN